MASRALITNVEPFPTAALRAAIEARIEQLIEYLDRIDGDPDLEDDDPAGGAIDDEGHGEHLLPAMPLYAVDQSLGPTNEEVASREYFARMRGE